MALALRPSPPKTSSVIASSKVMVTIMAPGRVGKGLLHSLAELPNVLGQALVGLSLYTDFRGTRRRGLRSPSMAVQS